MATQLQLRTPAEILGDLIRMVVTETDLTAISAGTDVAIFLEAFSDALYEVQVSGLKILESIDIDTLTGIDLDKKARSVRLPDGYGGFGRKPATQASGQVVIGSSFQKIATNFYAGKPLPFAGSTVIYLTDASSFPASGGKIYVGRGTADRFEGPISYSSVTNKDINNEETSFWTVQLSSPLAKNHLQSDLVVLAQGGDRNISAGQTVLIPASSETPSVVFTTTQDLLIPDGESEGSVGVICTQFGEAGNASVGGINQFASPPFPGATVTNAASFRNGRSREDDEALRERIKTYPSTLSRGTATAIGAAIQGLTDPETGRTIQSSAVLSPSEPGDFARVFIDDGTGLEPKFDNQPYELLLDSAAGQETSFKTARYPITAALIEGSKSGPFVLEEGMSITAIVGDATEVYTINPDNYINLLTASALEVARDLNAQSNILGFRTTDSGSKLLAVDLSGRAESARVLPSSLQQVLGLNTSASRPIFLYKNSELLSYSGKTATLQTNPRSDWDLTESDLSNVRVIVDGVSQTFSVTDSDFDQFATNISDATISQWISVLSKKIAGVRFIESGGILVWQTYQQFSENGTLEIPVTDESGLVEYGWIGDGGMWKPVEEGGVLSDTGASKDFDFNRFSGEIRLSQKPNPGDKIEIATRDTEAFIDSSISSTGRFDLNRDDRLGNARIVCGFDGQFVTRTYVPAAGATITPFVSGNILTLTANDESVFKNAKAADWIYLIQDASADNVLPETLTGLYKIRSIDASNFLIKVEMSSQNQQLWNAAINGGMTVFSATADNIYIFKSSVMPQIVDFGDSGSLSADEVIGIIRSQIASGSCVKVSPRQIRLQSNSLKSDGTCAVLSSIGSAKNLFTVSVASGQQAHTAFSTSSDLASGSPVVTEFIYPSANDDHFKTREYLFCDKNITEITDISDKNNIVVESLSAYNASFPLGNQHLWITGQAAGLNGRLYNKGDIAPYTGNMTGQDAIMPVNTASTSGSLDNKVNLGIRLQDIPFTRWDEFITVMDLSPDEKTVLSRLYKKALIEQIDPITDAGFGQIINFELKDPEADTSFFAAGSVYKHFDFTDFKILTRAVLLYPDTAGSNRSLVVRSADFGGQSRFTFRILLPTSASSESILTSHLNFYQDDSSTTRLSVMLPSGAESARLSTGQYFISSEQNGTENNYIWTIESPLLNINGLFLPGDVLRIQGDSTYTGSYLIKEANYTEQVSSSLPFEDRINIPAGNLTFDPSADLPHVVTVTTSSPHNFVAGDAVKLTSQYPVGGLTSTSFTSASLAFEDSYNIIDEVVDPTTFKIKLGRLLYYTGFFDSVGSKTVDSPNVTGLVGIQIDIDDTDDATTIAAKTAGFINLNSNFNAISSGNKVTVTNVGAGSATDASDVDANVTINVTTQGDAANQEVTEITINSASGADLYGDIGKYWKINSANDAIQYYVWYKVKSDEQKRLYFDWDPAQNDGDHGFYTGAKVDFNSFVGLGGLTSEQMSKQNLTVTRESAIRFYVELDDYFTSTEVLTGDFNQLFYCLKDPSKTASEDVAEIRPFTITAFTKSQVSGDADSDRIYIRIENHGFESGDLISVVFSSSFAGLSASTVSIDDAVVVKVDDSHFYYQLPLGSTVSVGNYAEYQGITIRYGQVKVYSPAKIDQKVSLNASSSLITSYPLAETTWQNIADAINAYLPANPVAIAEALGDDVDTEIVTEPTYVSHPSSTLYDGTSVNDGLAMQVLKAKTGNQASIFYCDGDDNDANGENGIKAVVQFEDSIFPTVSDASGTTYTPIGEEVYIVPTNSRTAERWLRFKATSPLNVLAKINRTESESALQISSRSDGSDGAVEVTGVSANRVESFVIGSSSVVQSEKTVNSENVYEKASKIQLLSADARALQKGQFVKIENQITTDYVQPYSESTSFFRNNTYAQYKRVNAKKARITFFREPLMLGAEPLSGGDQISLADLGNGVVEMTISSGGLFQTTVGDMAYISPDSGFAADAKCSYDDYFDDFIYETDPSDPKYLGYQVLWVSEDQKTIHILAPNIATFGTVTLNDGYDIVFLSAIWNEKNIKTHFNAGADFSTFSSEAKFVVKKLGKDLASLFVYNDSTEAGSDLLLQNMLVNTDDYIVMGNDFSIPNRGVYKIVAHNGRNHFVINNESAVDEIVDPSEDNGQIEWYGGKLTEANGRTLRIIDASSVKNGDYFRISSPSSNIGSSSRWFNSDLISSWKITGIGYSAKDLSEAESKKWISPFIEIEFPNSDAPLYNQTESNVGFSVTNGNSSVETTLVGHGLKTGDKITTIVSTDVGGIPSENLSVTNASITYIDDDNFSYDTGFSASSDASGSIDFMGYSPSILISPANQASVGFREPEPFYAFRVVAGHTVSTQNIENREVYLFPSKSSQKISQVYGTKVSAIGKLGFEQGPLQGIDGYKIYTGLVREAHRVIDGVVENSILYPGVKAAGAFVEVQTPLIKSVSVTLSVRPKDGVNLGSISDLVRTATSDYVNSLGVGSPVVLSEIISAVQSLPGVFSVAVVTTAPESNDNRIIVSDIEKAFILDANKDIVIG